MVNRAKRLVYAPGVELTTCSGEDLLVLKAFAGRPRDWLDIEGIIVKNGHEMDWDYVRNWLHELCEPLGKIDVIEELDARRRKHLG